MRCNRLSTPSPFRFVKHEGVSSRSWRAMWRLEPDYNHSRMAWSIDLIESLLGGKITSLSLPPETVISSFEQVQASLGCEWINSVTGKGIAPTLRIVGMGMRLATLETIVGAEMLVDSLRGKSHDSEAELTAIYLLRSSCPAAQFQLFPEVGNRKADFSVRGATEGQWATVEVTHPNTSKEHDRVQSVLKALSTALAQVDRTFTLDVLFRREPTQSETENLCRHVPEFCRLEGQQQADLTEGLGTLLLNKTPLGQVKKWTFVDREAAPIMGFAHIEIRGGVHRQVSVNVPFTDERAEDILRREARQLPERGVGFIMIDVGDVIGSFQDWGAILQRRFQPAQHTRVSAVCLFEALSGPTDNGYDWMLRTQLITNPHAQFKLPDWIKEAVISAGRKYDLASGKW
jgi:hypothetical protein